MLDRGNFWSPPDVTVLEGDGIMMLCLPTMPQIMASGDLERILAEFGLSGAIGLLGQTTGDSYGLRLARNRMLIVGHERTDEKFGWCDGLALTPMDGALAVFEISGPKAMELVARGASIAPETQSPAATISFAGVTCTLYRHDAGLRLHIDRGLAKYLSDWARATTLFA